MSSRLAAEIRQKKPFALLEEEAALNLVRTHEFLQQRQTDFFKQFQLTPTQYNILRILRGAGKAGVTCSQAAERMVAADPDITRLLDRLEESGFVERRPGVGDGRSTSVTLTESGRLAARQVADARAAVLERALGGLTTAERADFERLAGKMLVGMMRGPGAVRWICRLCDTGACRGAAGGCPVGNAARERYLT